MTASPSVVVLSGATGFVGSLVLERLIARGASVVALVRAADDAEARQRLEALALRTWGNPAVVAGVEVLAADLEQPRLGLRQSTYQGLARRADQIVHCAASVRFDLSLDDAYGVNVGGTERMVQLAARARLLGSAGRLVHVSTAFVHGRLPGLGLEDGPTVTPEFRNTYEQTKHRAEQVVLGLGGAAIVRPSIVVGDSLTGWTSSFNVVYPPVRALVNGVLDCVPAAADAILDLVPVDQLVDVTCALLDDPDVTGVVQAVGGDMAPTMAHFARLALEHAGLPMKPCVPSEADQIGIYAPYVDVFARFEFARAAALGMRRTPISELVPRMLDYADATAWGRRPLLRDSPLQARAAA